MRDGHDNVVVCSTKTPLTRRVRITGDPVTAPAMTLTDREYQRMRAPGHAILREVGCGHRGCNIRLVVNPARRSKIVIEMKPAVSYPVR